MSDLRARARIIAMAALGDCYPYQFSQDTQHKITDAILRGMVEAMEAEPDEGGIDAGMKWLVAYRYMRESDKRSALASAFRAMAAARAREIKDGK